MQKILPLRKQIGETPLETILRFKKNNQKYQNEKMAYAGRLDPMAEGLLLILVGDLCKKRKEYEKLPKTYEFEILFGASTDTFDLMGKIIDFNASVKLVKNELKKIIPKFVGRFLQEYPPYSSPRVNGKPLFWWARENRLREINIPKKRVEIYNLKLIDLKTISSEKLLEKANKRIRLVKGDFRQEEILSIWNKKLNNKKLNFSIAKLEIKCSSGVYVRSLVDRIGKELKIPTLAMSINRKEVGKFNLKNLKK